MEPCDSVAMTAPPARRVAAELFQRQLQIAHHVTTDVLSSEEKTGYSSLQPTALSSLTSKKRN